MCKGLEIKENPRNMIMSKEMILTQSCELSLNGFRLFGVSTRHAVPCSWSILSFGSVIVKHNINKLSRVGTAQATYLSGDRNILSRVWALVWRYPVWIHTLRHIGEEAKINVVALHITYSCYNNRISAPIMSVFTYFKVTVNGYDIISITLFLK
jgi:hypothetical protein